MRAVKRQVWGQGYACAFSNAMCLKRRVSKVGKASNYPKISSEPEPLLHLQDCFIEASLEPWALRFRSSVLYAPGLLNLEQTWPGADQ